MSTPSSPLAALADAFGAELDILLAHVAAIELGRAALLRERESLARAAFQLLQVEQALSGGEAAWGGEEASLLVAGSGGGAGAAVTDEGTLVEAEGS